MYTIPTTFEDLMKENQKMLEEMYKDLLKK